MNFDKINIGSIWAMITGTAIAVVYMFTTFVTASEFQDFQTDIFYLQFYELLEKRDRAAEDGRDDLAEELSRQLERIKAKICEDDPEWERCDYKSTVAQ